MARYVPDVNSHRWVIISPQRLVRLYKKQGQKAHVVEKKTKHDAPPVFCEGNEHKTPPEVMRIGGGEPNKPGWKVRVIPNKFSVTDYHEVFIHSPECFLDLDELPVSQTRFVLEAYRARYNVYRKKGQVMIFCNFGKHAGASIDHPHSQLVVLPYQINMDTVSREPMNNIVDQDKHFTRYCPDFSQWPYEIWIVPNKQDAVFGDSADEELDELAHLLKKTLYRLKAIYKSKPIAHQPFGYNYYIYPKENWYLRIIPRFIYRAGFELGTGLSVNVIDPQEAAEEYKKG